MHHTHHAAPVGLIETSPGQKAGARAGPQNAPQFTQRFLGIAKEHHAEARRAEIEAIVRKWQSMRIPLVGAEVLQPARARPLFGNFEQDPALRSSAVT